MNRFSQLIRNRTFQWATGLVVTILLALWRVQYSRSTHPTQEIRGGAGVNIQDLNAGRDINISINQGESIPQDVGREAPFVYASPVRFIIYRPSEPQAPGQTKAWIEVKLTNQSETRFANRVHVNFLTEDGTGHMTNSDSWNTDMGTPSLYTFDSIAPLEQKRAVWKPDIPSNAEALYKDAGKTFRLALHITWQDGVRDNEHGFLSLSELRYNRELDTFLFEVTEELDALHSEGRIREMLKQFALNRQ